MGSALTASAPRRRYPVILSIENHCSVAQQKKMAEYLKEVLQDKLDLSAVLPSDCKKLPSPEMLRGKVLIKVRLAAATGTARTRAARIARLTQPSLVFAGEKTASKH